MEILSKEKQGGRQWLKIFSLWSQSPESAQVGRLEWVEVVRTFREYSFSFVPECSRGFTLCPPWYLGLEQDQLLLSTQRKVCEDWSRSPKPQAEDLRGSRVDVEEAIFHLIHTNWRGYIEFEPEQGSWFGLKLGSFSQVRIYQLQD